MKHTHVRATAPSGKVFTGPIDNIELTVVNINQCLTAAQTAQAMEDGRAVRAGKNIKRNGWILEPFTPTPEAANDALPAEQLREGSQR